MDYDDTGTITVSGFAFCGLALYVSGIWIGGATESFLVDLVRGSPCRPKLGVESRHYVRQP